MGGWLFKENNILKNEVQRLNDILIVLPDIHFNCRFQVEIIKRTLIQKCQYGCSKTVNEDLIKIKYTKNHQLKQLRREIILPETYFYDLKKLFTELLDCPTPEGKLEDQDYESKCEVCFDKYLEYMLPCGHAFCQKCIQQWFQEKNKTSCPQCRKYTNRSNLYSEIVIQKVYPEMIRQSIRDLLNRANRASKDSFA